MRRRARRHLKCRRRRRYQARGMSEFDSTFPKLLTQLHQLEFDYDDGDGIDFEPYEEFQSAKDTGDWIKAWTGNHRAHAGERRPETSRPFWLD